MKKKFFLFSIIVVLFSLFVFTFYQLIKFIDYKSSLSHLKKYQLVENEIIIKNFQYQNQNYVISKYYNSGTWSHLNLLLKYKNTYYILKNIKNCDTIDDGSNLYIKENDFYIHCIGKPDIIDKYTVNKFTVEQETMNFNFDNTPNISQLHMLIDAVDDRYIYLSSVFKVDNTIQDPPQVKCSFKDKKCNYIE